MRPRWWRSRAHRVVSVGSVPLTAGDDGDSAVGCNGAPPDGLSGSIAGSISCGSDDVVRLGIRGCVGLCGERIAESRRMCRSRGVRRRLRVRVSFMRESSQRRIGMKFACPVCLIVRPPPPPPPSRMSRARHTSRRAGAVAPPREPLPRSALCRLVHARASSRCAHPLLSRL